MTDAVLEDYLIHGRFKDGLKQCEKRLKKNKPAVDLFVYKARFLHGLGQTQEATTVIQSLVERTPSINDTLVLDDIDSFLAQIAEDNAYPHVLTNGPISAKLWSSCLALTPKQGLRNAQLDRINSAVRDRRWQDAGTATAGWRQAEPERKDLRWLHVAILQIIADASNDPMTARINALQASKTIEKSLEQISNEEELLLIVDIIIRQNNRGLLSQLLRSDSKSFETTLRNSYEAFTRLVSYMSSETLLQDRDIHKRLWGWLEPSLSVGDSFFLLQKVDQGRAQDDYRLYKAFIRAADSDLPVWDTPPPQMLQILKFPPKPRLTGTLKMWLCMTQRRSHELLAHAKQYFDDTKPKPYCAGDLRDFVLSLSGADQLDFRQHMQASHVSSTPPSADQVSGFIASETSILRLEYLLTIGAIPHCSLEARYAFVTDVVRLLQLSKATLKSVDPALGLLVASALWTAYERDSDPKHLLLALAYLYMITESQFCYEALVLRIAICKELGFSGHVLSEYKLLDIKDIQIETASHIALSRVSVFAPNGSSKNGVSTIKLLQKALAMYEFTDERLVEQQQTLVRAERPELLLQLEDLRRVLHHSLNRRVLILEMRRLQRLTGAVPNKAYTLHPATVQMWTENLKDRRDFNTLPNFEPFDDVHKLERRLQRQGRIPDSAWISYNLWVDEICSIIEGDSLLSQRFIGAAPGVKSGSLCQEEEALVSLWQTLGTVAAVTLLSREEVEKAGWSGTDLTDALQRLQGTIDNLPAESAAYFAEGDLGLPSAARVQHIYLTMDFLQTVGRFTAAAQDLNKDKRPGKKSPPRKVADVAASARKAFDALLKLARGSLARLSKATIEAAISDESRFIRQGDLRDEFARDRLVETVMSGASQAWQDILSMRFGQAGY